MPKGHDFKLAPTRVIEPTGGPGAELATLEDAARFIGLMRPLRMEGREVQSTAEYQGPESAAAVNGGQPIEAEPSEVEPSSLDAMRACVDGIGDEPKEGISAENWQGFRLRIKDVAGQAERLLDHGWSLRGLYEWPSGLLAQAFSRR